MDSLADILANKDFSQPDEVTIIKTYVAKEYDQEVSVTIYKNEIIISSQSAGLISNLRSNSPKLTKLLTTPKKIRFRVG